MGIRRFIDVTFQWSGIHSWPAAKGRHSYLAFPHRHLFKGLATIEVFDDNRELEFLEVKDFILDLLPVYSDLGNNSCEWVAEDIVTKLRQKYGNNRSMEVCIREDGENGAIVNWSGAE